MILPASDGRSSRRIPCTTGSRPSPVSATRASIPRSGPQLSLNEAGHGLQHAPHRGIECVQDDDPLDGNTEIREKQWEISPTAHPEFRLLISPSSPVINQGTAHETAQAC